MPKKLIVTLFSLLPLQLAAAILSCSSTNRSSDLAGEYFEALGSAYYPVRETRETARDGAVLRTLVYSPDGKREKKVTVTETELLAFGKRDEVSVDRATSYQCAYQLGWIAGAESVICAKRDEGTVSVAPDPPVDISQFAPVWKKGWENGFRYGRAQFLPRPIGLDLCPCGLQTGNTREGE